MYQDERRLDFHALGREIKRKREAKGWTQEYLAQLVDRTPRSICLMLRKKLFTVLLALYFSKVGRVLAYCTVAAFNSVLVWRATSVLLIWSDSL